MRAAKKIPAVEREIQKEKDKMKHSLEKSWYLPGVENLHEIPLQGQPAEKVFSDMNEISIVEENSWNNGKVSGVIYNGNPKLSELLSKIYSRFCLTNPLHADIFKGVRKFDADIVRMTAKMLHGSEETCGAVTSGGTESILMAMKAYRDVAEKSHPEMIIPVTAHAAFDKAGHYFGIKVHHIPIDPITKKVLISEVKKKINSNTIVIVGSAPQFPHGVIDDIPQLAALAKSYGIPFHTDGCLGGYFLPWAKRMHDKEITAFDFSVPGVTSMSCDTHKYGFSVKGTSVVLFSEKKYRDAMFFVTTEWPGGTYASPTISGSRPGGLVACTWAALVTTGQNGYMSAAEKIYDCAQTIKNGIKNDFPELDLAGDSYSSVIAFTAKGNLDVYEVSAEMHHRGWHLNNLHLPACVHICCTLQTVPVAHVFLKELRESVNEALKKVTTGAKSESAVMYGTIGTFKSRDVVRDLVGSYIGNMLDL